MPAIIDSAPDCISDTIGDEAARVEDSADFVIGDQWQDCAGFMTFGPGSTYGEEGTGAETAYMILTWLGITVMVAVLVLWVVLENRRLIAHTLTRGRREPPPEGPQPGMTDAPELDRR
jgi:hypothetical protein